MDFMVYNWRTETKYIIAGEKPESSSYFVSLKGLRDGLFVGRTMSALYLFQLTFDYQEG